MDDTAEYWDQKYAARAGAFDADPNPRLPDQVAGLAPGHALEVGGGEGSDPVWLAAQGWTVEAVDISQVALDRGRAAAEERGLGGRIRWRAADILGWTPPAASYDLVTSHFVHFAWDQHVAFVRKLLAAVKPGGRLILVWHDLTDLTTGVRRPPVPGRLHAVADVAALLDPAAWDVTTAAALPRPARDHDGNPATVHDATIVATKR